jgi:hypothetical protein
LCRCPEKYTLNASGNANGKSFDHVIMKKNAFRT